MKKQTKKIYVIAIKATKKTPALWVELKDVAKFNKYYLK